MHVWLRAHVRVRAQSRHISSACGLHLYAIQIHGDSAYKSSHLWLLRRYCARQLSGLDMRQRKRLDERSAVFALEIGDFFGTGALEPMGAPKCTGCAQCASECRRFEPVDCRSELVFDLEVNEDLVEARGQCECLQTPRRDRHSVHMATSNRLLTCFIAAKGSGPTCRTAVTAERSFGH